MPRASAAPALLMATATAALLVARVHTTSSPSSSTATALQTLNPWLSACDLVPNAPASDDLQGTCSASTTMPLLSLDTCPPPCPNSSIPKSSSSSTGNNNNNNTTIQCLLYLDESQKDALCVGSGTAVDRGRRLHHLGALRLRHCCEHAVVATLRPRDRHAVLAGGAQCRNHLDALLEIDALASRISCEFTEVLTRYDCGQPYSIVYHCVDCKEAYRRWVCSSLVPHLTSSGGRVRPCRSVCQTVEQRCPYMLPGDRAPAHPTQYAGEPTFLCLDPNIPETGLQRDRSSHGEESCCYTYCGTPGRPPCVHCPRGATNASTAWTAGECAAATPPRPPSGPVGCRGGLLTAPPHSKPPSAATGSSSYSHSSSSSSSSWTSSSSPSRCLLVLAVVVGIVLPRPADFLLLIVYTVRRVVRRVRTRLWRLYLTLATTNYHWTGKPPSPGSGPSHSSSPSPTPGHTS